MPPDLGDVLLPPTHNQATLVLREHKGKDVKETWDSNRLNIHRDAWQSLRSNDARFLQTQACDTDTQSELFRLLCPSKADKLAWHRCRYAKEECRLAGVDVTQSIGGRMIMAEGAETYKCRTIAPTMMPVQVIWLSKVSGKSFHRLLLGVEALQLQVWLVLHPRWRDMLQKYSNRQLHDLAGDAFPAAIIPCVLTAVRACCRRSAALGAKI